MSTDKDTGRNFLGAFLLGLLIGMIFLALNNKYNKKEPIPIDMGTLTICENPVNPFCELSSLLKICMKINNDPSLSGKEFQMWQTACSQCGWL